MVNLNKFGFNKETSRIVQQQTRKVPVTRGNPLLVITETTVVEDIIKDPFSIESSSTTFTEETE
jgi:hypothetical protein